MTDERVTTSLELPNTISMARRESLNGPQPMAALDGQGLQRISKLPLRIRL